jgi:hypothetical protein
VRRASSPRPRLDIFFTEATPATPKEERVPKLWDDGKATTGVKFRRYFPPSARLEERVGEGRFC